MINHIQIVFLELIVSAIDDIPPDDLYVLVSVLSSPFSFSSQLLNFVTCSVRGRIQLHASIHGQSYQLEYNQNPKTTAGDLRSFHILILEKWNDLLANETVAAVVWMDVNIIIMTTRITRNEFHTSLVMIFL